MNYDSYLKDIERKSNPNGKRFTWNQMMGHRQQLVDGKQVEELMERPRHGICERCGSGRFYQKMVNREMVRVCKGPGCAHETIV